VKDSAAPRFLHANAVVLGEAGVLIRGPSGSGKSALSHAVINLAHSRGHFASLIGDDRIGLQVSGGRIIASGHPAIAGQIELRGSGIARIPYEKQAVIRLLADLQPEIGERMPSEAELVDNLFGISVRRIIVTTVCAERVLAAVGLGSLVV
jgi:serine kinase of HPr protein (carbohydrate metabolism regulator)